jgi:hypothetical protein
VPVLAWQRTDSRRFSPKNQMRNETSVALTNHPSRAPSKLLITWEKFIPRNSNQMIAPARE